MNVRIILGAMALPVLLGACSQVSALAPVSGGPVTTVRNAVYDVLVADQVQILIAPQCAPTDSGFTCEGSTVDGKPIVATAGPTAPYDLLVTIDGVEVFRGTAQDVINAAVQEAS